MRFAVRVHPASSDIQDTAVRIARPLTCPVTLYVFDCGRTFSIEEAICKINSPARRRKYDNIGG